MKKALRQILFWFLAILFLATAPIAIFYSQGYRFDWKKMIFVHSGAVTLKSLPSSVNIFLDGKLQTSQTLDIINNSATIGGLRPGNYHIQASLDGYSNWEKNVEVHSGISTEFWNVVLVPQNPEIKELKSENVAKFFPSSSGKKIAWVANSEKGMFLSATDFKKNESISIYSSTDAVFLEENFENIEWNYKEDLVLVPVIRNGQKDYLVASSENILKPFFLLDVANLENIRKARWSPREKNMVFFLADDKNGASNLYALDTESLSFNIIVPNTSVYDLSKNSIYFLQKNNVLFKSNLDGESAIQINNRPFTDTDVGKNARMIVYDEDRQILIVESGEFFVRNLGTDDFFQKIGSGVLGAQFSDDGKKLLFWNNNEIFVMFLRKWEVQPYRSENEIQTIIRLSSPVENVFWFRDYEHIFFSTQNKIKLIELDPRDRRICVDVFENNLKNFPAAYNSGNGYYFFVRDTEDNKKIFYFTLPEKTGIFG